MYHYKIFIDSSSLRSELKYVINIQCRYLHQISYRIISYNDNPQYTSINFNDNGDYNNYY